MYFEDRVRLKKTRALCAGTESYIEEESPWEISDRFPRITLFCPVSLHRLMRLVIGDKGRRLDRAGQPGEVRHGSSAARLKRSGREPFGVGLHEEVLAGWARV